MSESISQRALHARYLAAQPFLKQGKDLRDAETFTLLNDLRDAAPCDDAPHSGQPARNSTGRDSASLTAQNAAEVRANAQPEHGHE